MGSRTKKTRIRRNNKKTAAGQTRKKTDRNKGSTPKFAIHENK